MMWECRNANEIVDIKLLTIQFMKKIWVIILATLLGSLLVLGIYWFLAVTMAPDTAYESISKMHIDYALDKNGNRHMSFNDYTWGDLMKMDVILDPVMDEMDTPITKEELMKAIEGSLISDGRILTTVTTTTSKALTEEIAKAVEKSLVIFGNTMEESNEIVIIDSQEQATEVALDIRVNSALLLGGAMGFLFGLFAVFLYLVLDDSVYIPITVTKRYRIPMIGTDAEPEELELHRNFVKQKYPVIEEVTVGKTIEWVDLSEPSGQSREPVKEKHENLQVRMAQLAKADGILLRIESGKRNGTLIDKAIAQLELHDCKIVGAILINADPILLKKYYNIKCKSK